VTHSLAWWEGGDVNAVAFSPDGKWVAAGGLKGLRVWNAATGKLQKEIATNAAILALAYSPDGKALAARAFTQYVHLWDTGSWKETVLKGHTSEVRAVVYSPDGKTPVTGGVGECKVRDAAGELRKTVKHRDTVRAVVFTPDGKTVAIGSGEPRADRTGRVPDAEERARREADLIRPMLAPERERRPALVWAEVLRRVKAVIAPKAAAAADGGNGETADGASGR
jgi:WD40 repeat protein